MGGVIFAQLLEGVRFRPEEQPCEVFELEDLVEAARLFGEASAALGHLGLGL